MKYIRLKFFLILILFCAEVNAQIKIEFIREKIFTSRNTFEDDWVIAKDDFSEFSINDEFNLSMDYDYFNNRCISEKQFNEAFLCLPSNRDWIVIASVKKFEGTKLLFINELNYYSCITKLAKDQFEKMWALYNMKGSLSGRYFSGSSEKGGQTMHMSIEKEFDSKYSRFSNKYLPICREKDVLNISIYRTNAGNKDLSESIYMLRQERSKDVKAVF